MHGTGDERGLTYASLQAAETATKGQASPAESPANFRPYAPPNVVVAHLEEGLEAVDLASGQTLCKLYLPPGGLHTDLNADGMLDHIQVESHLFFIPNSQNPLQSGPQSLTSHVPDRCSNLKTVIHSIFLFAVMSDITGRPGCRNRLMQASPLCCPLE